jgi:hypothetical protein
MYKHLQHSVGSILFRPSEQFGQESGLWIIQSYVYSERTQAIHHLVGEAFPQSRQEAYA